MSQLSFYHELFHPTNQATISSTSEDVKVDHRFSIAANVLKHVIANDFYKEYDFLEFDNPREELEELVIKDLAEQGVSCSPYFTNEEREEYENAFEQTLFQYEQALKAWCNAIESERAQYTHAPNVEEYLEDVFYHYSIESRYFGVPVIAHYQYLNICREYVKSMFNNL